jgi:propionyl-CoA carboxylase alpha chain
VTAGVTVRNDTGVSEGSEISIWYDPMIAKLVTHAATREAAIAAQARALDAFAIDGIRHNIPFLAAVMQHPRWQEGRLSTGFIAEEFPDGFSPPPAGTAAARTLAAVAAAVDLVLDERRRQISGQLRRRPQAAATAPWRRRVVRLDDADIAVAAVRDGDVVAVRFLDGDGEGPAATLCTLTMASSWKPGDPVWQGTIDDLPVAVQVRPILNGFNLFHAGVETRAFVCTEHEARAARLMPVKVAADAGGKVLCPMPGLVIAIAVAPGQEVKAGETLAVIEAMKMENVLRAERDGVIKAKLRRRARGGAGDRAGKTAVNRAVQMAA